MLDDRLERAVRILFDPKEAPLAASWLETRCSPEILGVQPRMAERIRAAALKTSHGALGELEAAIGLASRDWRDLLMAAGFGQDVSAHHAWLDAVTDPAAPA